MSINVTLVPYADAINKIGSKKKGFFPRSCARRSLSVMDLLSEMEEGNIARAIADKAVVEGFMHKLFETLKKGDLVKVDGYGYFKPILTTKEGTDKTRLKDEEIVFAKIDFVLTVAGKEKLKDTQFVIKSKNL